MTAWGLTIDLGVESKPRMKHMLIWHSEPGSTEPRGILMCGGCAEEATNQRYGTLAGNVRSSISNSSFNHISSLPLPHHTTRAVRPESLVRVRALWPTRVLHSDRQEVTNVWTSQPFGT